VGTAERGLVIVHVALDSKVVVEFAVIAVAFIAQYVQGNTLGLLKYSVLELRAVFGLNGKEGCSWDCSVVYCMIGA
jgi:hypothetical protein